MFLVLIEKKSTTTTNSTIIHGNSSANYNGNFSGMMSGDILKKTSIPKKNINHKKSKSYITSQTHMMQDSHNLSAQNQSQLYNNQQQLYYQQQQQQMMKNGGMNGSTLENSFGYGASGLGNSSAMINKSYERILAETIEAQNMSAGGIPQNYISNQYYQIGAQVNQKISSNTVNQHNMTLQLSSKRGNGSANVSHTRIGSDQYDTSIKRDKSISGHQSTKSNHNSQKSLTSNSKYDQQHRKKSRGSDQFQMSHQPHHNHHQQMGTGNNRSSKVESNRTSKKNSPSNTINTSKGTINIREARTKPTSPERSQYIHINSFKQGTQKLNGGFAVPGSMVNQREERKALNMISNIGSQQQHQHFNRMSSNQIVNHHQPRMNNQDFVSIQQQATSKRKNFKNMFYSPKGGREAYTEPHSKFPSQAHTKEHSPAHRHLEMSQQLSYNIKPATNSSIYNQSLNYPWSPPQDQSIRQQATYLTQEQDKQFEWIRRCFDVFNQRLNQNIKGAFQTNSFLEESYLKNATNQFNQTQSLKREDISFDSSQNQFSQTGTPNHYKVKISTAGSGNSGNGQKQQVIKKINIVGREVISSQLQGPNHIPSSMIFLQQTYQQYRTLKLSNSTIERKPKKIILQNGQNASSNSNKINVQYPHTTGLNSQAPSPTNSKILQQQQQLGHNRPQNQQKKQRFMSEAPSPQNLKVMSQLSGGNIIQINQ